MTEVPRLDGGYAFTALVRRDDDPIVATKRSRKEGPDWWRRALKEEPRVWADRVVAHLSDGVPRTFHRICVELVGCDGSVCFKENPWKGVWLAVEQGRLEYESKAPARFRAWMFAPSNPRPPWGERPELVGTETREDRREIEAAIGDYDDDHPLLDLYGLIHDGD